MIKPDQVLVRGGYTVVITLNQFRGDVLAEPPMEDVKRHPECVVPGGKEVFRRLAGVFHQPVYGEGSGVCPRVGAAVTAIVSREMYIGSANEYPTVYGIRLTALIACAAAFAALLLYSRYNDCESAGAEARREYDNRSPLTLIRKVRPEKRGNRP